MLRLSSPLTLVLLLFSLWKAAYAERQTLECEWDIQCEELYKPGSKCMDDGKCSNPFAAGCLFNYYMQQSNTSDDFRAPDKRICNSDDTTQENCNIFTQLNYPEIRVHNGNWESALFFSWIIQIFLSEFLHVPTTVGLSPEDTPDTSFYNPRQEMSLSSQAYAFEEMVTANRMNGRCDLTNEQCVHVMPEVWPGQEKTWKSYALDGNIDQVNGDGQIGKISWYIPAFTARHFPQLTSYYGMAGRREEMAQIFKRPTSWGQYCTLVSPNNCTEPDEVAARAPLGGETEKYFQEGLFTGYFRYTEQSNCTLHPDSCTGHIVAPPCSWSTDVDAQTYHNDVALESNGPLVENRGYTYSQMISIWRAANQTKTDIVMWWWTPDATVEEFRGTDFQFQPVLLPEATAECRRGVAPEDRCSMDPAVRRGKAGDGCDVEASSLQKVVAASLRDTTYDTPEVDRSPGYQAILNLKVDHLDMHNMLQKWVEGGRTGYAARDAVCGWVVEHQAELESYIPRGYPRVFAGDESFETPLLHAALGVAGFACMYILVNIMLVCHFKTTRVFVNAQAPFIFMVLVGLLLVACGSIFFALEPQDGICATRVWLTALGYTLELVPLVVKVAAINRITTAAKRMRRVKISLRSLFCTVASLVIFVVVVLTLWTALDAPKRQEWRYLIDEDPFEIVTTVTCASDLGLWDLMLICWNGLLIACATILAFQARTVYKEFNDSRALGTMIYSHVVFAVLRAVTFYLGGSVSYQLESGNTSSISPPSIAAAYSFLLSADAVTAVTIYIVPKVAAAVRKETLSLISSEQSETTRPKTNHIPNKYDFDGGISLEESTEESLSGHTEKPRARPRSTNNLPSINEVPNAEEEEEIKQGLEHQHGSFNASSNSSGALHISMDGNVYEDHCSTDEEGDQTSSSNEMEYGGGRLALRTLVKSADHSKSKA